MVCYRGGALNEQIYVVEEQDECRVKHLLRQNLYQLSPEQTHALPDILRYIANGPFYALQTNGDGACAMHALFGNPTFGNDNFFELKAQNARSRAIACFQPSLAALQQKVSISSALRSIETALWKEFVEDYFEGTSSDESTLFWKTLITQNPQLAKNLGTFSAEKMIVFRT